MLNSRKKRISKCFICLFNNFKNKIKKKGKDMKTSNAFKNNLNNGIITEEMLSFALYAANKRAKNYRDNIRHQKQLKWSSYRWTEKCERIHRYNIDRYNEMKDKYYNQKETMLSLLTPICIHEQKLENKSLYFLFYMCGRRSFHTPIYEEDLKDSNLKIIEIKNFETHGANIKDLASTKFVENVVDLIESGDFEYIPDSDQIAAA